MLDEAILWIVRDYSAFFFNEPFTRDSFIKLLNVFGLYPVVLKSADPFMAAEVTVPFLVEADLNVFTLSLIRGVWFAFSASFSVFLFV